MAVKTVSQPSSHSLRSDLLLRNSIDMPLWGRVFLWLHSPVDGVLGCGSRIHRPVNRPRNEGEFCRFRGCIPALVFPSQLMVYCPCCRDNHDTDCFGLSPGSNESSAEVGGTEKEQITVWMVVGDSNVLMKPWISNASKYKHFSRLNIYQLLNYRIFIWNCIDHLKKALDWCIYPFSGI